MKPCASRKPGRSRSNRRGRKRSPPFTTGSPQGAPLRQLLGGHSAAPLGSPLWKTGTTAPNHNLDRKCRIKRCSLQTCWERPIRLAEISSGRVAGNGSEWVAGPESESLAGLIGISNNPTGKRLRGLTASPGVGQYRLRAKRAVQHRQHLEGREDSVACVAGAFRENASVDETADGLGRRVEAHVQHG